MTLTRRQFVGLAAVAALPGARGIYELIDRFGPPPPRAEAAAGRPQHLPEQHILQNLRIVTSDGVQAFMPPLHSRVVTAMVRVDRGKAVAEARRSLAARLQTLDARFAGTPTGLGVTVAWGRPYFERYVNSRSRAKLPIDVRASSAAGHPVPALAAAIRFPSDPDALILERNDVAVLLRSDSLAHIEEAQELLFGRGAGLFDMTSIRSGFAGAAPGSGQSLPKRMAVAAGVPGAEHIPAEAELFLGFTSTQKQMPGRERITNFETLGYTSVTPSGYFAHGTHMHLSHIYEDLEVWYRRFTPQGRLDAAFRPGLDVPAGTLTVAQGPHQVETPAELAADYRGHRQIGHSGSIQAASRLRHAVTGPDGVVYKAGTPIPHRADFNTLDHPFAWTATPARDRAGSTARAGLHFAVFNPSSDDFNRGRLAMDGRLPDGRVLAFGRAGHGQGINAVLTATHRQNFLVPPRAHRSFPLSEL